MEHDISKLPKWAQNHIEELRSKEERREKYWNDYFIRLKSENDHFFHYANDDLDTRIKKCIDSFRDDRNRANRLFSSLLENAAIGIKAIWMIAKRSYGLNHKQRNARLDVLCDTCAETLDNILNIRDHGFWEYYQSDPFTRTDWDFRQVVYDKFKLQRSLESANAKIQELENQLNGKQMPVE